MTIRRALTVGVLAISPLAAAATVSASTPAPRPPTPAASPASPASPASSASSTPSSSAPDASTPPPPSGPLDPTSADVLSAAAERSAAEPSRFEMYFAMTGLPIDMNSDVPMATGEVDGDSIHMRMDLGAIFGDASAAGLPAGMDFTMEMLTVEGAIYIKAPMFADLAEQMGDDAGPLEAFVELGDGWGYIDPEGLGADAAEIGAALGAATVNPGAFYATLATASKLEVIGTEPMHDTEATGVRAMVDFDSLMEAQGGMPASPGVDVEALEGLSFPLEVWVGEDGYIHRIVFTMDEDTMAAAAEADTESSDLDDMAEEMSGVSVTMRIDSFDFGDPEISVVAPTDFVDITDAFSELMELGAATTG